MVKSGVDRQQHKKMAHLLAAIRDQDDPAEAEHYIYQVYPKKRFSVEVEDDRKTVVTPYVVMVKVNNFETGYPQYVAFPGDTHGRIVNYVALNRYPIIKVSGPTEAMARLGYAVYEEPFDEPTRPSAPHYSGGRKSGKGALTPDDIRSIRASDLPTAKLAKKYKRHPDTILRIKRRHIWASVE